MDGNRGRDIRKSGREEQGGNRGNGEQRPDTAVTGLIRSQKNWFETLAYPPPSSTILYSPLPPFPVPLFDRNP